METYLVPMWVVECGVQRDGCISMVKAADAQATVEALQGQIVSLQQSVDVLNGAYESAVARAEALQRERDALKLVNETHMKTVMTLSHIVERSEAALDAEREKGQAIIKDTKNMLDVATRSVREELTQLQALVRAFIEAWDHDGEPSAVAYEDAVARARATLDATTPAGQRWTREKPTVAGFYWYRELFGDKQMRVVELVQSKVEPDVLCEASGVLLCYFTGEWILCPLTPDSYQQGRVAGLREAHVFAMEAGAFYTAHRISALIDKAQQAQEEKGVGDGN